MTAKYEILFKGDYLEVHSDGEKDLEFAYRLWTDVVAACKKHNCCNVLGIANTTSPVSVVDGYQHADMSEKIGYPAALRVAWVECNPDYFDVIKFVETVLFNRGIAQMKAFRDVDEALEWLVSGEGV